MASLLMALFDGLVLQWLLEPDAVPSGEELISALAETMTLVLEDNTIPGPPAARNGRARRPAKRRRPRSVDA
jgi:hypothetical protein